jgi:predicted membrane-bound mannosyltransferase
MASGLLGERSPLWLIIPKQKRHKSAIHSYDLCAGTIISLSFLLHLYLITIPWPQTNSDEATMGLMARDILYHGKFVVMYYGQDYMGTLQAYLSALFFNVFGPTVFTLRFGVVLELTCFLVVMYYQS